MLAWRLCLYSDGPVLISQVGLEAAQEVLVREILKELPCALVASGARSIALAFPAEAVRPQGAAGMPAERGRRHPGRPVTFQPRHENKYRVRL